MPKATEQTTTPTAAVRRRRLTATPTSNVVALPKRLTGTDAIVAEVTGRSKQQSDDLCRRMDKIIVQLEARKRETANELLIIGMKMDMGMMMDLIEIGRRMLAGRA
jgi:hypothetical protein